MSGSGQVLSLDDLTNLVEVTRALTAEVGLHSLLNQILEQANQLTDSTAGSVILFDAVRDCLYFAHATGPKAELLLMRWGKSSEQGIPLVGSIAGEAFRTGVVMRTDAVAVDPLHFKEVNSDTATMTDSMICVPLSVGSERIGVVQLLNKRDGDFTDRDLLLLDHFAAQAAVAIRNARLFADLLAHMGLYLSPDTDGDPIELLAELRQPARSEVLSVLFADMRGFTQLCHVTSRPENLQALLNEYLTMLAQTVIECGGLVNKFLGDGLLALFRGDDHAQRALRAAILLVQRFDELRASWDRQSNVPLSFLDLGVGVATDTATIGAIGSGRVRDFTAVGTTVNLAANLMDQARGGRRVLVDHRTFMANKDRIDDYEGPHAFELRKPGQQVGHPYQCYHIRKIGLTGDPSPRQSAPAVRTAEKGVFVSYSHADAKWLEALQVHLRPYTRSGSVSVWDDTRIRPGDRWREEIQTALASAGVAVLLVSPQFLASEFIAQNELPPLLSAAGRAGLRILWVPVSACSYDETPIEAYRAVFDPKNPLDGLSPAQQNQAWVSICKQIKAALSPADPER